MLGSLSVFAHVRPTNEAHRYCFYAYSLVSLMVPSCFGIVPHTLLTVPTCLPAPGGTRIDDGDKTKMTNHCVFSANEDHETIRNYAQVEPGVQQGNRSPKQKGRGQDL